MLSCEEQACTAQNVLDFANARDETGSWRRVHSIACKGRQLQKGRVMIQK